VNESADPRRVGTDPDGVKFIAVSFSRWPPPTVLRTPRKYTLGHVVLKYERWSRFVIGKASQYSGPSDKLGQLRSFQSCT
jgi:hypothetical protein